uniref:Tyrosine specific protein phosphatases domain-containing protein n=1 Tax=Hucho hucho TaxID=62062 RepID=A0A4W5PFG5_9TELE
MCCWIFPKQSIQDINFSWVEPNKLAKLALPQMTSNYLYLLDNCIQHLLSQTLRFLSIGVAVYCMHGHGRTGTMLAKTRKISGIDVINEIRRQPHVMYGTSVMYTMTAVVHFPKRLIKSFFCFV